MRKKLLLISHAGVIPANRELFRELSREFEVRFVVPKRWKGSLISDLSSANDQEAIALPAVFSGNGSLFFYASLFREARKFGPDLIFLDEEPWSLVALQIFLFFPKLEKIFYTKQNLRKAVPWPFSWIQSMVFRSSSRAFVISQEAAEVLRWKGFEGNISELPHSLNGQRFKVPDSTEKSRIRRNFGLPEKFLVGYFGRLTEEKGLREIQAAAEILFREKARLAFVLVGNGPLSPDLQAFSRRHPDSFFVLPAQPHDKVQALMSAMDLSVLASRTTPRWKEQFGRVIIESAACGVPIVGSDSGEIPRLVARMGGAIFPEGNAQALAGQIRRYAGEEAYYGASSVACQRASAEFTHEAVGEMLIQELLRDSAADTTKR